jgi:hypothetical protein
MTTIGLLAAVGISQTPLFFRYRTVADIPSKLFLERRKIWVRLLRTEESTRRTIEETQTQGSAIRIKARHLSPWEVILPKAIWEVWLRFHPAAAVGVRLQDNPRETLTVQVAGLTSTTSDYDTAWLDSLAKHHPFMTLELLGRRLGSSSTEEQRNSRLYNGTTLSHHHTLVPQKRVIPGFERKSHRDNHDTLAQQIAVGRLYYRPQPQLFATDLGLHMVRWGHANPSNGGLYGDEKEETPSILSSSSSTSDSTRERRRAGVVDTTESVQDLQKDVKYMEQLVQAEYTAAREARGQWADPGVRSRRRDIVEEVEFQATATFWQKLWRRLRGG